MESKHRMKMPRMKFSIIPTVYLAFILQICLMNGVASLSTNETTMKTQTTTLASTTPIIAPTPTATNAPNSSATIDSTSSARTVTLKSTNTTSTDISTTNTDISTTNTDISTTETDNSTPVNKTMPMNSTTKDRPTTFSSTSETTAATTSSTTVISVTTTPGLSSSETISSQSTTTTSATLSSTDGTTQGPPVLPNAQIGLIIGLIFVATIVCVLLIFVIFRYRKTGSLKKTCIFKDDPDYQRHISTEEPSEPEVLERYPRSIPLKIIDLPDICVEKSKNSGLVYREEYGMISKLSPRHPQTASVIPENQGKNRYRDILPFEHNRVLLEEIDDDENSDYINASFIPGYVSDREYIACQGPTENTIDDHWRMMWEQNIRIIVMVTKCEEGEIVKREKCVQYWPDKDSKTYGDITVSILSSEKQCRDNYKIRKLDVRNGVETRIVYHFQYIRWPDKQNPEDPEGMLEFREAIRDTMLQFEPGPIVVHCSAGVGRSGTYIAIDILLQHMEIHDGVDVYGLILKLRNSRVYMVQTPDQYMFVHSSLLHVMDIKRKQEVDDGNTYININDDEDNPYENIPMAKKPAEQKSIFSSGRKNKPVPIVSNSYKHVSGDGDDIIAPPKLPKPGQNEDEIDQPENHAVKLPPPIPTKLNKSSSEMDSTEMRLMKEPPPMPTQIDGYENNALTLSQDPIPIQNGTSKINNLENSIKGDNTDSISESDIVLTADN